MYDFVQWKRNKSRKLTSTRYRVRYQLYARRIRTTDWWVFVWLKWHVHLHRAHTQPSARTNVSQPRRVRRQIMRSSGNNLFVGRNKINCREKSNVEFGIEWHDYSVPMKKKKKYAQTPQIAISSKVPRVNNIFSARESRYPYGRYVWGLPSEKGPNKTTYSFEFFFLFAMHRPHTAYPTCNHSTWLSCIEII